MDRTSLSLLAHSDHPIAVPIGDDSVERLLDRTIRRGDEHVLDLGCGQGEWLLRILHAHPGATAVGVDAASELVERARVRAAGSGVDDRLELHQQDATRYEPARKADVILAVGSAHAFGGLLPTLAAAKRHLSPDGAVLVGEGFWERDPDRRTLEALDATREEFADLATTVDRVVDDGWTPVYGHVSTVEEWDEYEWCWTGSLAEWALDHPEHPDRGQALDASAAHRAGWLGGYRGTLGFVTLLLRPTPPGTDARTA